MSKKKISIEQIISSSISDLKEEYREISGNCGWHQYLGNDKIGNVASSQALLLLQECNVEFGKKQKVINTLIANQFLNEEDIYLDGGWSYKSNYNEAPTTECTAWVLLALYDEVDLNSECINKGILWLQNNHLNNSKDNGWGSIKSDVSRVYSTCLSLQVFSKYNKKDSEEYKSAFNWLKRARNDDGGWGETNNNSSKLTHTSHAIITLISCGVPLESQIIKRGISWILEQTEEIGSWSEKKNIGWREHIEFEGKRITFYHYSIAWIIKTLQLTNYESSIQYKFLMNELLIEEEDGNWVHPYLESESHYTMWSKHDAIMVLKYHQLQISDEVIVKLKPKKTFQKKNIFSNWMFVSLISAILAVILIEIVFNFPALIEGVVIFSIVFVFVYLRNPIKRYFRIAQSLITLLVSLLILPTFKVRFEKIPTESTGIKHFFFELLTNDTHILVYVIIGFLISLCFILDYKIRRQG